jgi:hypothetical protein
MELQPVSTGRVVETAGLHRVSTRLSTGLESAQSGDSSPGRAVKLEVPSSPTHSRRSYWAVALLAVTTTFVFADQNLMASPPWCCRKRCPLRPSRLTTSHFLVLTQAPNLSAIAKEFNMSDEERDQKLGGASVAVVRGG